jgi:HD-GYP domain-containing protein (c-di-GMP phosphodiesterase class II)
LARSLVATLSLINDSWEIVNNSAIGEFGSPERSPAIAAYAGLMSLLATLGEPVQVTLAALLADVGMLEMSPELSKKLRQAGRLEGLADDEMEQFMRHPLFSVDRCEARKFPIKDRIKEMILNSHEKADGSGFPQGKKEGHFPVESQLIQFSEMMDRETMIKIGKPRVAVTETRRYLLEAQLNEGKFFSAEVLQKLKPVI